MYILLLRIESRPPPNNCAHGLKDVNEDLQPLKGKEKSHIKKDLFSSKVEILCQRDKQQSKPLTMKGEAAGKSLYA